MMIDLRYEYETIDGDYIFDIVNDKRKIGELILENNYDAYVIKATAYTDFYILNKDMSVNQKVNAVFESLDTILEQLDLDYDKPILLAEDESIANYYAIQNNLRKVPRWYGFYYEEEEQ
jgi:hypothetical protein